MRRRIIHANAVDCVYGCGKLESATHLFLECGTPTMVWLRVQNSVGISTVFPGKMREHFRQFTSMAGMPRSSHSVFKVIWFAYVWVIWKDHNNRVFNNTWSNHSVLFEKVKLNSFLWLKAKWPSLNFCYHDWWQHPFPCLGVRM